MQSLDRVELIGKGFCAKVYGCIPASSISFQRSLLNLLPCELQTRLDRWSRRQT